MSIKVTVFFVVIVILLEVKCNDNSSVARVVFLNSLFNFPMLGTLAISHLLMSVAQTLVSYHYFGEKDFKIIGSLLSLNRCRKRAN